MFSLIKTPNCNTNPLIAIYALLSNFLISRFTRFFAPPRPGPPRGFSSSPRPAEKNSAPHIPGMYVYQVYLLPKCELIVEALSLLCSECNNRRGVGGSSDKVKIWKVVGDWRRGERRGKEQGSSLCSLGALRQSRLCAATKQTITCFTLLSFHICG